MANHRFKRSSKSTQRGRGKNHGVNRKRCKAIKEKNYYRKIKEAENNRIFARIKNAIRMYWRGEANDMKEAMAKTK